MDSQSAQNLERLKDLSRLIDIGDQVEKMLLTVGWEEIVGPMLDKMITDVLGGKENGEWHNGSLDDKRLGEAKINNLVWYKRALTDFHKYIYQYIKPLPQYRAEYSRIVGIETNPELVEVQTDYENSEVEEQR